MAIAANGKDQARSTATIQSNKVTESKQATVAKLKSVPVEQKTPHESNVIQIQSGKSKQPTEAKGCHTIHQTPSTSLTSSDYNLDCGCVEQSSSRSSKLAAATAPMPPIPLTVTRTAIQKSALPINPGLVGAPHDTAYIPPTTNPTLLAFAPPSASLLPLGVMPQPAMPYRMHPAYPSATMRPDATSPALAPHVHAPVMPLAQPPRLEQIKLQVEYYFSANNLAKDVYLRQLMNARGYVPVCKLLEFNRLRALTSSAIDLLTAAKASQYLKTKNGAIRSRTNWQKYILKPESIGDATDEECEETKQANLQR